MIICMFVFTNCNLWRSGRFFTGAFLAQTGQFPGLLHLRVQDSKNQQYSQSLRHVSRRITLYYIMQNTTIKVNRVKNAKTTMTNSSSQTHTKEEMSKSQCTLTCTQQRTMNRQWNARTLLLTAIRPNNQTHELNNNRRKALRIVELRDREREIE